MQHCILLFVLFVASHKVGHIFLLFRSKHWIVEYFDSLIFAFKEQHKIRRSLCTFNFVPSVKLIREYIHLSAKVISLYRGPLLVSRLGNQQIRHKKNPQPRLNVKNNVIQMPEMLIIYNWRVSSKAGEQNK